MAEGVKNSVRVCVFKASLFLFLQLFSVTDGESPETHLKDSQLCVCTHACTRVHMHAHGYIRMHMSTHARTWVHAHAHGYTRTHMGMHIRAYTHTHIHMLPV